MKRQDEIQQPPDTAQTALTITLELQALIDSGICTVVDGVVNWREGQLEYLAREFERDPFRTEYLYKYDLAVARAYSADTWRRLIGVK